MCSLLSLISPRYFARLASLHDNALCVVMGQITFGLTTNQNHKSLAEKWFQIKITFKMISNHKCRFPSQFITNVRSGTHMTIWTMLFIKFTVSFTFQIAYYVFIIVCCPCPAEYYLNQYNIKLTFRCRKKLLVEFKVPEILLFTQNDATTLPSSTFVIVKNVPSKILGIFFFNRIYVHIDFLCHLNYLCNSKSK